MAGDLAGVLSVRSVTPSEIIYNNETWLEVTLHDAKKLTLAVSVDRGGSLTVRHADSAVRAPLQLTASRNPRRAEAFCQRGVSSALVSTLGYHVGIAKGLEDLPQERYTATEDGALTLTATGYAELAWLARASTMHGWEVLSWKQRRHLRKSIHHLIDDYGLRAKGTRFWSRTLAEDVRIRREAMFTAIPQLEMAVTLYGGRFGKFHPFVDPETGTMLGASASSLIPGLGNLPAALLSGDPVQQWRYLAATGSHLPGYLWALVITSTRWGRKRRDPWDIESRRHPPLPDNFAETAGGAGADVLTRVGVSIAAGGADPALLAEIAGRRLTGGISSAVNDIQAFSPTFLAYVLHDHALGIAARGEPADELARLEVESRRLHLALAKFLTDPKGSTMSDSTRRRLAEAISSHNTLLQEARTACAEAHLKPTFVRTGKGPKRAPAIKHLLLRWSAPSILGTVVATSFASLLGEAAFGLLGLPGIVSLFATIATLKLFQSRKTDDKAKLKKTREATQGEADAELRAQIPRILRESSTRDAPVVDRWKSVNSTLSTPSPHMLQAAKIAPFSAAATTPAFFVPTLESLAVGFATATAIGPFANAFSGWFRDHDVRKRRREMSDAAERAAARELFNEIQDVDGYLEKFAELDSRIFRTLVDTTSHKTRPEWVESDSFAGLVCDAISARGSATLTRKFVAKLERTGGKEEAVASLWTSLLGGLAPQSKARKPLHRKRKDDPKEYAEAIAQAFDERHETDLTHAAEGELLELCARRWLPPELHATALFPRQPRSCATPLPDEARLDNEDYVAYMRAISQHPYARKRNGQLRTDGVFAALAIQLAVKLVRKTSPPGSPLSPRRCAEALEQVNASIRTAQEKGWMARKPSIRAQRSRSKRSQLQLGGVRAASRSDQQPPAQYRSQGTQSGSRR